MTKSASTPTSNGHGQGPTGRGFLLWDGTGRVFAKKFGYRDGSGRVMRKSTKPKITYRFAHVHHHIIAFTFYEQKNR